jgi:APA family basic amino acid/polyamine antiporter
MKSIIIKDYFFLLLLVEYLAWFIGWNYALLYEFAAMAVVADWSEYVINLIDIISGYNVTSRILQSPVIWDELTDSFIVTGQVINLPAVAITVVITIILISGIRQTAIVNLVLVVIKIIILLIFIFACSKYVNRKNFEPFFPPNQGTSLVD